MRDVGHVRVDDAQVDQRRGKTGAGAPLDLRLQVLRHLRIGQMHPGQHRAGLGLPVAGEDVDAARHRGSNQSARHGGAAHNHLQLGQIDILAPRRAEQHLQDGRHAMRGRHPLARDQSQEHIRRIATRIDLLVAHHGVEVRAPPRVDMKHRGQRHIDVFAVNASLVRRAAIFRRDAERMQHQLAVAEIDPFRTAGRAGRVKRRRARVLVKIRKLEKGRTRLQHVLVFALDRQTRGRLFLAIVQQHVLLHRRQLVGHLLHERQEVRVDQYDRGGRVVHRIQQPLRRQREIDRLQHRPHHRHGEIAFEIAMAVPVEHAHDVARLDAEIGQPARQSPDALAKDPIAVPPQVPIDDLVIGRMRHWVVQQMLDEKRVLVSRRTYLDKLRRHSEPPPFRKSARICTPPRAVH